CSRFRRRSRGGRAGRGAADRHRHRPGRPAAGVSPMEQVIELPSEDATRALGRRLGAALQPGDFVALVGDLGAGKTLLVKAVAEGAGAGQATSPSFAILNVYRGGRVVLQHLALYR